MDEFLNITTTVIEDIAEINNVCPFEVAEDFIEFVNTIERVKELFDLDDDHAIQLVAETWRPCYL